MTVIRPNSISGITSLTAHRGSIDFYAHDGSAATFNNINSNVTSGVSTFASLNITGDLDVGGALTYEDVTNIDSIGIITARAGINATGDITFGANSKAKLFENGTQSGVQATNSGSSAHLMTHDGNEDIHVDPSGYIKFEVAGSERLRITSGGHAQVSNTVSGNDAAVNIYKAAGSNSDKAILRVGYDAAAAFEIYRIRNNGDIFAGPNQSGSDFIFQNVPTGGSTTERLRIFNDGSVRIGDNSIAVAAVGGGPTLAINGAAPEITLRDSATNNPYAVMRTNDFGSLTLEADQGNNAANSTIHFRVDNAERMRINSSYLLHGDTASDLSSTHATMFVGSNHAFQHDGNAGTYLTIAVGAANGTVDLEADARSGGYPDMRFITTNTERLRIKSDGTSTFEPTMGHGARNMRIWAYEANTWRSFIGTNLDWDGSNFYKNSDHGSYNWGNVAGITFDGGNVSNQPAIRFLTDLPSGSSNVPNNLGSAESVITSRTAGYFDTAGRLHLNNQPCAMAYNAQGQHMGGGSVAQFNSTRFNIGNMYNSSNGRMTVPVAGRYLVAYSGLHDYVSQSSIGFDVRINGSQFDGGEGYQARNGTPVSTSQLSKTLILSLSANDYVEIYIRTSGTQVHQRYGSFSMCLIT